MTEPIKECQNDTIILAIESSCDETADPMALDF